MKTEPTSKGDASPSFGRGRLFSLPHNGPTFRMIPVPGTGQGHFTMGSPEDEPERSDDERQLPVQVSDFHMAEFLVTQELGTVVMGANPSDFKGMMLPVENVSWFDAAVFCNALNKLLDKKPSYLTAQDKVFGWDEKKGAWYQPNEGEVRAVFEAGSFRLPTEAEWEYAARGGPFAPPLQKAAEKDFLYAGSDQLEQVGWFGKNSDNQTHDVGLLLPNALGLYDMSGNVFEWCYDWYGDYPNGKELDPKGPKKGNYRVLRGGAWNYDPRGCRSAFRYNDKPAGRSNDFGFRLVFQ